MLAAVHRASVEYSDQNEQGRYPLERVAVPRSAMVIFSSSQRGPDVRLIVLIGQYGVCKRNNIKASVPRMQGEIRSFAGIEPAMP